MSSYVSILTSVLAINQTNMPISVSTMPSVWAFSHYRDQNVQCGNICSENEGSQVHFNLVAMLLAELDQTTTAQKIGWEKYANKEKIHAQP